MFIIFYIFYMVIDLSIKQFAMNWNFISQMVANLLQFFIRHQFLTMQIRMATSVIRIWFCCPARDDNEHSFRCSIRIV